MGRTGRTGGTGGTGSALSHGGSPEQNWDKTAGAGCCWGLRQPHTTVQARRGPGATMTPMGCIAPPQAMLWKGSQLTRCHLKEGLSVQT